MDFMIFWKTSWTIIEKVKDLTEDLMSYALEGSFSDLKKTHFYFTFSKADIFLLFSPKNSTALKYNEWCAQ